VAFGGALSQEDPQDPQDPLNLPEDACAFFGRNPSNIYEKASSCNLDFFSFFLSSSLRYSLVKDRQLQQTVYAYHIHRISTRAIPQKSLDLNARTWQRTVGYQIPGPKITDFIINDGALL
jgi:hypothetical protein